MKLEVWNLTSDARCFEFVYKSGLQSLNQFQVKCLHALQNFNLFCITTLVHNFDIRTHVTYFRLYSFPDIWYNIQRKPYGYFIGMCRHTCFLLDYIILFASNAHQNCQGVSFPRYSKWQNSKFFRPTLLDIIWGCGLLTSVPEEERIQK